MSHTICNMFPSSPPHQASSNRLNSLNLRGSTLQTVAEQLSKAEPGVPVTEELSSQSHSRQKHAERAELSFPAGQQTQHWEPEWTGKYAMDTWSHTHTDTRFHKKLRKYMKIRDILNSTFVLNNPNISI